MKDIQIALWLDFIVRTQWNRIPNSVLVIKTELLDDSRTYTHDEQRAGIALLEKERATQYWLKQNKALAIEIPEELSADSDIAVAQLAIAVGRRLERFERGRKANATRTPNSRQKSAQKAIQTRWSEK